MKSKAFPLAASVAAFTKFASISSFRTVSQERKAVRGLSCVIVLATLAGAIAPSGNVAGASASECRSWSPRSSSIGQPGYLAGCAELVRRCRSGGGLVLIALGVAMITGRRTALSIWPLDAVPVLGRMG